MQTTSTRTETLDERVVGHRHEEGTDWPILTQLQRTAEGWQILRGLCRGTPFACDPYESETEAMEAWGAGRYVWLPDWGTAGDATRLDGLAEAWLTEHEGDLISIRVRRPHRGEAEGVYLLRDDESLQLLGGSFDEVPDAVRDLTSRAWEAALRALEAELAAEEDEPLPVVRPEHKLTWIVPPECGGQIVEVAYATDSADWALRRTADRSDRSVTYERAPLEDLEGEWEPWNGAPDLDVWEPCEVEG